MHLDNRLVEKLGQIRLWRPYDNVTINNPTDFKILGQGQQGVVFRIDDKTCVKMYFFKKSLELELRALRLGAEAGICPKVYFWGDNYIVMEYIDAPSLYDYLERNPLTKELAQNIIDLLETFAAVGFNRFDHSARHIFLVPGNKMKVIDVVHVIKDKPVYLSEKLISDMRWYADDFIDFVREISPKWYERWVNHPDFAEVMEKANEKSLERATAHGK